MTQVPSGSPVLRVQALQDSLDSYGRVRAGWLFGLIDQAAMLVGEHLTQGAVAAVSINTFQLQVPVYLNDTVTLYAECLRKGQSSLVLKVSALVERSDGNTVLAAEVIMTYVAVDDQGKSRQIA
ncbi:MAG: acyl-CoA thioesterase [Paludibacterium sp.]|uniref:acyl-CoA thioesterase n=1 Tax=Paludibacterium sp. TaxID=1917523 RepID=UPI0025E75E0F|nr:hotdog domain-containing protein [Paludibacterium sp.]MBV8046615.1 acyl-CoA thioesterase [Paludibacterium sp.]MBV8646450.1 acyl-CoA thioesterase [Paludibacterium sp.]